MIAFQLCSLPFQDNIKADPFYQDRPLQQLQYVCEIVENHSIQYAIHRKKGNDHLDYITTQFPLKAKAEHGPPPNDPCLLISPFERRKK